MTDAPVAIVGSVSSDRTNYKPPVTNVDQVEQAARELGAALAEEGKRLLVFSSSKAFIEPHVVSGYLASGKAKEESIVVRYPAALDEEIHGQFDEQNDPKYENCFETDHDPHDRWEVSYYMSLSDISGMVLFGGGRATLIMGLMALATRRPLVCLRAFGGSASVVWTTAKHKTLASDEDYQVMALPLWSSGNAVKLAESLTRQERELERRKRGMRNPLVTSTSLAFILLMVLGLAITGLSMFNCQKQAAWFFSCIIVPVFFAVAGALGKRLWDMRNEPGGIGIYGVLPSVAFGMFAGILAGVGFVTAQTQTISNFPNYAEAIQQDRFDLLQMVFVQMVVGLGAGFTFETIIGALGKSRMKLPDAITGED